ncbi:putative cysteine-rich receptor-like protein kinase 9 [Amaranthus tricolor]|uniref:putative cysteine-rich receptor-like protein kinase 9 n=1 Tax=Amaranthus tricolor TaxID=29722 RepID=UPI00258E8D35|nr:putative cysteine-rich receptor-like protein kinase 9 [Amaranthus tricolor]
MAITYTTVLIQSLFLFFFLCNPVSCDDRESYSNRLRGRSTGCLRTKNATISFQNNVITLFSDFNRQSSSIGFYNNSIGDIPDRVYGYYMCRGDVSNGICNNCIINGTKMAMDFDCDYVDGDFESELCIFRYSNHNMYGLLEMNLTSTFDYLDLNISNYQQFNRSLSTTLEAVINEAAFGSANNGASSRLGFATKEGIVSSNETIYALAQCTPDIVGVNCSRCLRSAFNRIKGRAPAAVSTMAYKCHLRFDNVSFYDLGMSNDSAGKQLGSSQLFGLFSLMLFMLG